MTERTDKVAALHAQLTEQVAALVTSDDWRAMLETAARFHTYSPRNVMLIMHQNPDATRVAGFRAWLALGRHVRKGEHGLMILAPMVYKTTDEAGEDGHRVAGFKVAHVFDIAQTDGDELPDMIRPALMAGEAPEHAWNDLAHLVAGHGYTIERAVSPGNPSANGSTHPGSHVVYVRPDRDDAQAVKTLAHELAHIRLGHVDGLTSYGRCRGTEEVEAESVAYIVTAALGLDSAGYSLPYVATWSNGDADMTRKTAERVMSTARTILAALATDKEEVSA